MKIRNAAALTVASVVMALGPATTALAAAPCDGATIDQFSDTLGCAYVETEVTDGQTAVVLEGSGTFGDGAGYVGVSNDESQTASDGDPCQNGSSVNEPTEGGNGPNSGGCYGTNRNYVDLRGGPLLTLNGDKQPVPGQDVSGIAPLPVCGDDTGPYKDSTRDGCRADVEDVDQAIDDVLDLLP